MPSVDRLFGHIEVFAKFVPGEVASHESIVAVALEAAEPAFAMARTVRACVRFSTLLRAKDHA